MKSNTVHDYFQFFRVPFFFIFKDKDFVKYCFEQQFANDYFQVDYDQLTHGVAVEQENSVSVSVWLHTHEERMDSVQVEHFFLNMWVQQRMKSTTSKEELICLRKV